MTSLPLRITFTLLLSLVAAAAAFSRSALAADAEVVDIGSRLELFVGCLMDIWVVSFSGLIVFMS